MNYLTRLVVCIALMLIPSLGYAQSIATVRVPKCLEYTDTQTYVPCTGVVPVDPVTGNAMNWLDVFKAGTQLAPSAIPPVMTTLTAAGTSSSFSFLTHRKAHALITPGTGTATCSLQTLQDGVNWYPITTVNGTPSGVVNYTGAAINEVFSDDQANVLVRWNCTSVTGSVTLGFTQ